MGPIRSVQRLGPMATVLIATAVVAAMLLPAAPASAAVTWGSVSANEYTSCALRSDHTLWCWGDNGTGQLGTGDLTDRSVPTRVGSATTWASVSVGTDHVCAIRTDHTLWCWGDNSAGELGGGSAEFSTTARRVGSRTDWAQVTTGMDYTCAVTRGHTLWCWGSNFNGTLGLGSAGQNTDHSTPTRVGTSSAWAQVSAHLATTCAVRTDHTLWCWGDNTQGGLGIGSTTQWVLSPHRVSGSSWSRVTTGDNHTCALTTGRTLWCWGGNTFGELGIGSTTDHAAPVKVGASAWLAVTTSDDHTCAIRTDHSLWCWGLNHTGQLGVGYTTTTWSRLPLRVGHAAWRAGAAGGYQYGGNHTCAVGLGGSLWCWGYDDVGQVGDGVPLGTEIIRRSPVKVG